MLRAGALSGDVERRVTFGQGADKLSANDDGIFVTGMIGAGWNISIGKVNLEPWAGVSVTMLHQSDDTERSSGPAGSSPSGAALHLNSDTTTDTASWLGVRASVSHETERVTTAFDGNLAWRHSFEDQWERDARFAGSATSDFSIVTANTLEDAAVFTLRAQLENKSELFLATEGSGLWASDARDWAMGERAGLRF